MEDAIRLAEARFDTLVDELSEYLRIPSISTLPEHTGDMRKAAEWTAGQLRDIGMSKVVIFETGGHPIVYGEWLGAPEAPTVLIYGHYDVQPTDPLDEWDHDPFDPVVRDNHIVARGAADDKGMVYINLKAVQALMEAGGGQLPLNVKFLLEGEEEIGSEHLEPFIEANRTLLRADVVVISDSTMLSLERPAISVSFRGITYVELEVRGPAFDLHSGQHGGVVHNPIQALCEIVAALHHPDGSVAVEGFYDRVRPIEPEVREELARLYSEEEFRAETGAPQSWGEQQFNLRERIVARPTLELNGIVGGWTGTGRKTVLPAKAIAKISCRLVPEQDPHEIAALLRRRIAELTPSSVRSEVRTLGAEYPSIAATDHEAMKIAVGAYERGFGTPAILMRKGGTLPAVGMFAAMLNAPVIAAGYGLPSDRVHGPNERFHLECLRRGIVTAIALFDGLGKLQTA